MILDNIVRKINTGVLSIKDNALPYVAAAGLAAILVATQPYDAAAQTGKTQHEESKVGTLYTIGGHTYLRIPSTKEKVDTVEIHDNDDPELKNLHDGLYDIDCGEKIVFIKNTPKKSVKHNNTKHDAARHKKVAKRNKPKQNPLLNKNDARETQKDTSMIPFEKYPARTEYNNQSAVDTSKKIDTTAHAKTPRDTIKVDGAATHNSSIYAGAGAEFNREYNSIIPQVSLGINTRARGIVPSSIGLLFGYRQLTNNFSENYSTIFGSGTDVEHKIDRTVIQPGIEFGWNLSKHIKMFLGTQYDIIKNKDHIIAYQTAVDDAGNSRTIITPQPEERYTNNHWTFNPALELRLDDNWSMYAGEKFSRGHEPSLNVGFKYNFGGQK